MGKPQQWDGLHKGFGEWEFAFSSYISVLSAELRDEMREVQAQDAKIDEDIDLSDDGKEASRVLYYLLSVLVKGTALQLLKQHREGHGLSAWQDIYKYYRPIEGGRQMGMLSGLLEPPLDVPEDRFQEELLKWENNCTQYTLEY
eukprot:9316986-Alexandrium_andersonii.AAC.1